ncbi:MAG: hypothetical protein K9W43_10670 [Candidatus Thorarchaeota archaeon]|nr:hypothetical protein [Candidatus Thorarchaeota archaeon]
MRKLQSLVGVSLLGIIFSIFSILFFIPEFFVSSIAAMLFYPVVLAATISLFVLLERGPLHGKVYGPDRAFRFHNPAISVRAIFDQNSGEQRIVRGSPELTYHDTLERGWPFADRPVDSEWLLVDEHGSDISQRTLASYDGPVYIIAQEDRS